MAMLLCPGPAPCRALTLFTNRAARNRHPADFFWSTPAVARRSGRPYPGRSRMLPGMNGSVTLHIDAPPDKVWQLVSDVTRIGRYSPETFEAEWLDGAT